MASESRHVHSPTGDLIGEPVECRSLGPFSELSLPSQRPEVELNDDGYDS
jgi:hypothetical protein